MNQRALLLVNRRARRGQDNLSNIIDRLKNSGLDLFEESVSPPQNLPNTIRRYQDRVDMVIVGGGDGTLNAALDGLIEAQLPLGILPLGTANDLARTLGISNSLPEACDVIVKGRSQPIDIGWVNGKHFFNVASLGLSVKVTEQLSKEMKRRWGIFAYAFTALKVLSQSVPFYAEIRMNGEIRRVSTVQIAIGNGRYYGGGMAVASDASIDDQRLDLYSIEIKHWWQMIALLPGMRSGTLASWSFVTGMHGQEIEIYTPRHHSVNTDGEITTSTPAKFKVIPKAISVFVP